jgi:hypothetical protein
MTWKAGQAASQGLLALEGRACVQLKGHEAYCITSPP